MSEGPTTEGSIVAKLSIDKAEASSDLAEFQAQAEGLKATDPSITVKANTAEAQAALDAVTVAEKRLALAEAQSDIADGRALIARQKLSDMREAGAATNLQLQASELTLAAATLRADAAGEKVAASEQELAMARAQLIAANEGLAASEEEVAEAEKKTASGGGGYWQMIATAIGVLLPMMGPLAAAAVGTGASLVGMGAAGVLAYEGITKAIAAGTAEGQQYSQLLGSLKSDLGELEATAAADILGAFDTAVVDVNAHLPQLNMDVGMLSQSLGVAGGSVLQGFLNGLGTMTPLVDAADKGVQELANDFDRWTTDGGLAKFVNYAEAELPIVGAALGSLGKGVVNVVEDLAPLGNVMLDVAVAGGHILSFLASLGPTLPMIAGGALAGYAAFQLWGAAVPIINSVSTAFGGLALAEDAAEGPVGWIAAGIAALAVVTGVAVAASEANTQAVTDYTQALQQDSDAIGANVKATAAKALQDAGAYDAAKYLGLSYGTVTEAALGNAAAQKVVNDATAKGWALYNGAGVQLQYLSHGQQEAAAAAHTLRDAVDGQNSSLNDAINAASNEAAAVDTVRFKQDTAATAIAWTTTQLTDQTNATTLLNNAFTLLDGGTLGVAQAQTAMAAASNSVVTSMKTNGTVIDGSTAKAVANQQAIEAQVTAAQQYAEAVTKQTGSTQQGIAAYQGSLAAIQAQLQAQGQLTPAVQAYITKLYGVPTLVNTVVTADTSQADAAIVALEKEWAKLPSYMLTPGAPGPNLSALPNPSLFTTSPGKSSGGYVNGMGTTTSDSNLVPLSDKEFVVKASSAGYAPAFLNAYNQDPKKALSSVGGTVHNHYNLQVVTQADPQAAVQDGLRRLQATAS